MGEGQEGAVGPLLRDGKYNWAALAAGCGTNHKFLLLLLLLFFLFFLAILA